MFIGLRIFLSKSGFQWHARVQQGGACGIQGSSRSSGMTGSSRCSGMPGSSRCSNMPGSSCGSGMPGSSRGSGMPGSIRSCGMTGSSRCSGMTGSSRGSGMPGSSRYSNMPVSSSGSDMPGLASFYLRFYYKGSVSRTTLWPWVAYMCARMRITDTHALPQRREANCLQFVYTWRVTLRCLVVVLRPFLLNYVNKHTKRP